MISTSGKPQFVLRYNSYIDDENVAHCELTGISPRQNQINPESGAGMVIMLCAAAMSRWENNGWPKATARPAKNAVFNREFGLKLAKKKMFRKAFNDLCNLSGISVKNEMLKSIRQEIALYYYMNGVRVRLQASIDNMNEVAAVQEGDKPHRTEAYCPFLSYKESVETMLEAIDNYLADRTSDKGMGVEPGVTTEITDETQIDWGDL